MSIQNQHQPGVFTEYGKDWEHGTESCSTSTQEAMQEAPEKAGSVVSKATEKVKEAASFVGEKAEQATHAVGAGMESLGHKLHGEKPAEGMLYGAKEAVAEKLEGAGHYLEEQGLKGIATT